MTTEPIRSPLRQEDDPAFPPPPPPPPPHNTPIRTPPPMEPAVVASRHDLSTLAAKVEANVAPPHDWYPWNGQREAAPHDSGSRSRVVTGIVSRGRLEKVIHRAAVAARLSAAVLCLVSFSVLSSDRDKGWALDSYHRYKQYRYCVSVNVIGFVYSGFQLYSQVHNKVMAKHIIRRPLGDYFDFAMDQILAYLLISSSSSATARTDDWVSNWGSDAFPNIATGSVAISFLAFLVFALSALISAHKLFSRNL
ncbi:CASP-like protein 4A1 [Zingiber officinale]|uniref:CASP-like protein n=1 Tax=Zingiber officinale TaxID=94328 RepID=A0A8J5F521_ZINOF|nr:CASP-like protein 4A1 [Zingiber officinale]KAG6479161.1 hypothetical protein ZIOFF_062622 [Zingiber officinale]